MYICTNKILVNEQYGLRINISTEAASYSVINGILKAVNNRFSVGKKKICDLEKDFDCVNCGITVDKLEFSGISWKSLTVIQPYLGGIYQKVLFGTIN